MTNEEIQQHWQEAYWTALRTVAVDPEPERYAKSMITSADLAKLVHSYCREFAYLYLRELQEVWEKK